MNRLRIVLMIAVVAVLSSCSEMIVPSKNKITEVRPLSGFSKVLVSDGIHVTFIPSEEESVKVYCSDNVMSYVDAFVSSGQLVLKVKNGVWFSGGVLIDITVTAPSITSVALTGGSDFELRQGAQSDSFILELSGGSDFEGSIVAKSVSVALSGGSECELRGSADSFKLTSSGGSDFGDEGFITQDADMEISGGAQVRIAVTRKIVGEISGGSRVRYEGAPSVDKVSLSGGSTCLPIK